MSIHGSEESYGEKFMLSIIITFIYSQLQSATVCIAFSFIITQVRRMTLYDFSLKPVGVFIVKIH